MIQHKLSDSDSKKEELRPRLGDYVSLVTTPSRNGGKNMYVCPLCRSGTKSGRKSDGAFHLTGDKWFCHSCLRGGDIFSLYAEINGLDTTSDFSAIVTGLSQALGSGDSSRKKVTTEQKERREEVKEMNPERLSQIEKFASQLAGSPAETYLRERGFSDDLIKKYRLGYDRTKNAVVIPYPGTDYYTKRLISPAEGQDKYDNLPGTAPTFMIKESETSDYYFVTEGQLDALSMIQVGAKNVIASHYPSKIEDLIDGGLKLDGAIIVADRDEPGERIARSLTDLFTEKRIKSLVIYPPEGVKDSNDLLRSDPDKLKEILRQGAIECQSVELKTDEPEKDEKEESEDDISDLKSCVVSDFLSSGEFDQAIRYFTQYQDRKTGFSNIDRYLTLYPGLACLTGSTSLGKTSFAVQLCDQLVDRGETVLYFTLEQLPIEIVTKSLARRVFLDDESSKLDNIKIKNGVTNQKLEKVKKDYIEVSKRFHIIESDFRITAGQIDFFVRKFIQDTGVKPIVVVDYLQLISAPEGKKYDDRERIDDAVKKLKLLSKNNELFVLMISNMSRATYRERIGEDSFKESGLIEYTCDYLFGLQLAILEDDSFFTKQGSRGGEKETQKSEKQNLIDQASEAIPKEVVFKSLKNRNGKKTWKAFFKYRPDFDFFEVDLESKYDPNRFTRVSGNEVGVPFKDV